MLVLLPGRGGETTDTTAEMSPILPQQHHNNHHEHEHVASRSPPQQVLLEDLTLVIDVALIVAFATAIHLLRQKFITVATLAHALSVAFLVFTVEARGGWWVVGWSSAGILSAAAVIAIVGRFWSCKEGGVYCAVGDVDPLHNRCKLMRLRFFAPVFSATVVFVYLCISSRVNALLGGSVLHPTGGGYALAVLASPTLMSAICLSGCASVWLYDALAEEQASGSCERLAQQKDDSPASRPKRLQRHNNAMHQEQHDPSWGAPYSGQVGKGGRGGDRSKQLPPSYHTHRGSRTDHHHQQATPSLFLSSRRSGDVSGGSGPEF
ncbi:unnamed protein product, partial [Pylaiella littoralis]